MSCAVLPTATATATATAAASPNNTAWAEKLWSSAELQQALRHPPAIGGAKSGTAPGAAAAAAALPAFQDLKDLIAEGIPAALQQQGPAGGAGAGSSPARGGGGGSGAFMMGGDEEEEETSFLGGVVTAIPRVEVRAKGCSVLIFSCCPLIFPFLSFPSLRLGFCVFSPTALGLCVCLPHTTYLLSLPPCGDRVTMLCTS